MGTTIKRLKSDTPDYFKKIRAWASLCAAVLAAVTGVLVPYEGIPLFLKITLGVLTAVFTTIAGFTFLTTNDPTIAKK